MLVGANGNMEPADVIALQGKFETDGIAVVFVSGRHPW